MKPDSGINISDYLIDQSGLAPAPEQTPRLLDNLIVGFHVEG
jgi:hypothetical protein